MSLNNKFLDNISYDQAIFTNSLIYRKMKNLNNGYDIYVLTRLDDRFVWDKTNDYNMNHNVTTEEFNDLRCVNGADKYLTIYRLYEGMATNLMIYNSENMLVWNNLNIPMDINNIHTTSLLDIPSHIDLTKEDECLDNKYDEPFEMNFEPLCGWDNLLKREPPDDLIINDNNDEFFKDILEDEPIHRNDNFNYPDTDDEKSVCFNKDLVVEIPEVEYRSDPYDNEWYSKDEFMEYYGGLTEWNNQDPKLVLKRYQYYKFSETFDHLSNRRFEFLFKKFEKTFV
tara:strand:+ start:672 stop:1520 length:849 start_codon:yes stop_codon:yes gene_type:complete